MPISTYQDAQHHQMRKPCYICTMEYYSAIKKNTFESVLMRWMKLVPIIQSEVSQKDKHQYSILKHINGIQKDGNDNPICRQKKRHRYIEQTFGLYRRRQGLDDLREQHWNMYIIKCETDPVGSRSRSSGNRSRNSPGWMHETSAQGWCTEMTQRDGMGNTCKSMADSCHCMAKTTKKYFKKIIKSTSHSFYFCDLVKFDLDRNILFLNLSFLWLWRRGRWNKRVVRRGFKWPRVRDQGRNR